MWLTILAHDGGIGFDELALFLIAGLFSLTLAGVWLFSRRFKPVIDGETAAGDELSSEDEPANQEKGIMGNL